MTELMKYWYQYTMGGGVWGGGDRGDYIPANKNFCGALLVSCPLFYKFYFRVPPNCADLKLLKVLELFPWLNLGPYGDLLDPTPGWLLTPHSPTGPAAILPFYALQILLSSVWSTSKCLVIPLVETGAYTTCLQDSVEKTSVAWSVSVMMQLCAVQMVLNFLSW